MTRDEFIDALKREPADRFLEERLLRRVPLIFDNDEAAYFSWRKTLSALIDVDPSCVLFVGSSATGFSLNPNKNFKMFDDESDIDIAIISSHYFNISWRFLRMNKPLLNSQSYKTREAWKEHTTNYIYWGTIAADKLLGVLPFGKEWMKAASTLAGMRPTLNRDIKLRIYNDHDALRSYHLNGIIDLRNNLFGAR